MHKPVAQGSSRKLTEKQVAALRAAQANKGGIFQLPERQTHSLQTLASLVKAGLLTKQPVGVIWSLSSAGSMVLEALDAEQKKKA